MKLYTEEQVREVIEKVFWHVLGDDTDESIISELTPIELPSDEEIRKESFTINPPKIQNDYGNDYDDNIQYREEWLNGAKWVINHINQQKNEN
jgi:hypothetical protein